MLKCDVGGVDARVRIVLAEHAHTGKAREGIDRRAGARRIPRSHRERVGPNWCRPPRSNDPAVGEDGALLGAVCRDGPHLRQHVLPAVVDTPACAQNGLMVVTHVPGKSEARLEFLLLIVQRAIRRERRIAQEDAVRGLGGIHHRVGENLRLPAQAVVKGEVWQDLPFILDKECEIFVLDI